MALFSKKNNISKEKDLPKKSEKTFLIPPVDNFSVILRPRITEKATIKSEDNVYVFEVLNSANKKEISKAVLEIYKVSPIKVNIIKIPSKNVFFRRKKGVKRGGKKAYVYLKEGDKIELI